MRAAMIDERLFDILVDSFGKILIPGLLWAEVR